MARRSRRSAWGSVLEVAPGVWRIRYWAAGPDGYRRRSVTVRGTRIQAEQRRSELMLAHAEDAPCPAVGEVWRAYAMPDMERRVNDGDMSRTTVSQYAGFFPPCAWSGLWCPDLRLLVRHVREVRPCAAIWDAAGTQKGPHRLSGEGLAGLSWFLDCPAAQTSPVYAHWAAQRGARNVDGLYGVAFEQLRGPLLGRAIWRAPRGPSSQAAPSPCGPRGGRPRVGPWPPTISGR